MVPVLICQVGSYYHLNTGDQMLYPPFFSIYKPDYYGPLNQYVFVYHAMAYISQNKPIVISTHLSVIFSAYPPLFHTPVC